MILCKCDRCGKTTKADIPLTAPKYTIFDNTEHSIITMCKEYEADFDKFLCGDTINEEEDDYEILIHGNNPEG